MVIPLKTGCRFIFILAIQITIDGHNIQDLNLKCPRSKIGVVSHEPVFFNTTITENIVMAKKPPQWPRGCHQECECSQFLYAAA